MRPLSSTACRYSPVNTRCFWTSTSASRRALGPSTPIWVATDIGLTRRSWLATLVPTGPPLVRHRFAPLCRHSSRDSGVVMVACSRPARQVGFSTTDGTREPSGPPGSTSRGLKRPPAALLACGSPLVVSPRHCQSNVLSGCPSTLALLGPDRQTAQRPPAMPRVGDVAQPRQTNGRPARTRRGTPLMARYSVATRSLPMLDAPGIVDDAAGRRAARHPRRRRATGPRGDDRGSLQAVHRSVGSRWSVRPAPTVGLCRSTPRTACTPAPTPRSRWGPGRGSQRVRGVHLHRAVCAPTRTERRPSVKRPAAPVSRSVSRVLCRR